MLLTCPSRMHDHMHVINMYGVGMVQSTSVACVASEIVPFIRRHFGSSQFRLKSLARIAFCCMPRKRKQTACVERQEDLKLKRICFTISALLVNHIAVGAQGALPREDMLEALAYILEIAKGPTELESTPSPVSEPED